MDSSADVERLTAGPSWVTEWQYPQTRELLWRRAELVVWLDLPTRQVMTQVTARTVRRRLGRQTLWNGNLEAPLRTFWTDPDHVVRWAWSSRHLPAQLISSLLAQVDRPVIRLRSRREADRWLDRVG